jgi:hypothetical protein
VNTILRLYYTRAAVARAGDKVLHFSTAYGEETVVTSPRSNGYEKIAKEYKRCPLLLGVVPHVSAPVRPPDDPRRDNHYGDARS